MKQKIVIKSLYCLDVDLFHVSKLNILSIFRYTQIADDINKTYMNFKNIRTFLKCFINVFRSLGIFRFTLAFRKMIFIKQFKIFLL